MAPLQSATWMVWMRACCRKLKFISAGMTPILANPSQTPMYSGLKREFSDDRDANRRLFSFKDLETGVSWNKLVKFKDVQYN